MLLMGLAEKAVMPNWHHPFVLGTVGFQRVEVIHGVSSLQEADLL